MTGYQCQWMQSLCYCSVVVLCPRPKGQEKADAWSVKGYVKSLGNALSVKGYVKSLGTHTDGKGL